MSYQKPLVTIELDEYNKMLEYIKLLDDSIGDNCNKYKSALQDIVDSLISNSNAFELNYQFSPIEGVRDLILKALNKNNIGLDYNTRKIN